MARCAWWSRHDSQSPSTSGCDGLTRRKLVGIAVIVGLVAASYIWPESRLPRFTLALFMAAMLISRHSLMALGRASCVHHAHSNARACGPADHVPGANAARRGEREAEVDRFLPRVLGVEHGLVAPRAGRP